MLVRKGAGLGAQRRTLCSTIQHSTTWWSDGKFVRKEAGLRALVYQSTQYTWWSDGKFVRKEAGLRALVYQSTQYHVVVRWKAYKDRGGRGA